MSSLELSVDLLRRELLKDSFALYQLNLISPEALLQSVNTSTAVVQNPIRMGTTLSDPENPSQIRFIPFDNTKSLREIGIKDGSSIFIREIVSNVAPSPSVNIITTSNTNTNKDDQK